MSNAEAHAFTRDYPRVQNLGSPSQALVRSLGSIAASIVGVRDLPIASLGPAVSVASTGTYSRHLNGLHRKDTATRDFHTACAPGPAHLPVGRVPKLDVLANSLGVTILGAGGFTAATIHPSEPTRRIQNQEPFSTIGVPLCRNL
jgi:hypothetical protein